MLFSHSAWPFFYPHEGCVSFLCMFSSVTCLESLQYKAGLGRPFRERTANLLLCSSEKQAMTLQMTEKH